ncbi:Tripartite motif-containing protein 65 isoform X4 [Aphelenchoides besseyi]|nr:Tripartite motif-containing protein 65 isoform X4 [Aphelenchoides besseyi]
MSAIENTILMVRTEDLECGVCLHQYVDPELLPCGHSFCSNCLKLLVNNKMSKCPMCRESFDISVQFPKNYALNSLLSSSIGYEGDFGLYSWCVWIKNLFRFN